MQKSTLFFLLLVCSFSFDAAAQKLNVKQQFTAAGRQLGYMLELADSARLVPGTAHLVAPRTQENGNLKLVRGSDWTSGFFAGALWLLYENTGKQQWLTAAKKYTALLDDQKYNGGTHDLGFMIYCSFGNGYRLTADTAYRSVIVQAAKTLCTRFNRATGVIQSWNKNDRWNYPVIIDNMMNLELLFEATKFTGDSSFYKIAVTHANTTIKNHFRPDNSSFHVVDYDPQTGAVKQKNTAQGYSDASAWARGQAWGLYGYTMCYRETKDPVYLQQAKLIADYILSRLPAGEVPFWDYDAPGIPNEPRDASAAAITASALYELNTYVPGKQYRQTAGALLKVLANNYTSKVGENNGFLLLHSTGHKPAKSEIDVPIIYADYYFLEALMRSKKMK